MCKLMELKYLVGQATSSYGEWLTVSLWSNRKKQCKSSFIKYNDSIILLNHVFIEPDSIDFDYNVDRGLKTRISFKIDWKNEVHHEDYILKS